MLLRGTDGEKRGPHRPISRHPARPCHVSFGPGVSEPDLASQLRPELAAIAREAFESLVLGAGAVSLPHRRAIARRVVVAAREPFASAEELVARAQDLDL